MPRQVRIEFPGVMYHVMCRGDRRQAIFRNDSDREMMLATLAETVGKTGWALHAWVWMSNPYHLLVETPEANLVEGMTWFQTTYTTRFNALHRLRGHLFGGRYKAVLVDREEPIYFRTLLDYIHLNPVRARIIKAKPPSARDDISARLACGGYPEATHRKANDRRAAWFASYISTILQRDVRDLARVDALHSLPNLLKLLAARASGLLNLADVGLDASLPHTTLTRYLALLETVFLIHRLPAWSRNLGQRLVKAPKLHLVDTGLACQLLGKQFRAGVVLYLGDQILPFGDNLWLIPMPALWAP